MTSTHWTRASLAAALERAILLGELAPGHRLPPERVLAESHGMSRTAVREALRTLVDQGLVESTTGRGTFVRELDKRAAAHSLGTAVRYSRATVRQLVDARRTLESEAAGAAARLENADLTVLRTAAEALADPSLGIDELARRDLAFHRALVAAGGNPVVTTMFEAIADLSHELMRNTLAQGSEHANWVAMHQAILHAVEGGDPAGTAVAVDRHFAIGEGLYGDAYDRPLPAIGAPSDAGAPAGLPTAFTAESA